MTKSKIGLALGSGSARGWSHIGVIEALDEAGIRADIVCGCSIGSLVGAAYVAGRLPALRDWALAVTWREIVSLLDVKLSAGGLIEGRLIRKFLRDLKIEGPIESYAIRFAAVATDLQSGREIWLEKGPIDEAVRSSISLPGIFSPTQYDGRWLVDGGLVNPVPISMCRALGADLIIAVDLNGDLIGRHNATEEDSGPPFLRVQPETVEKLVRQIPPALRGQASRIAERLLRPGPATPGYFDVLSTSINIMQDRITRSRLAGEPPDVLLMPRLGDFALMEFNRAKEAIAEGRDCVAQALPLLRKHFPLVARGADVTS
jgi:NTE family protein